jgi:hypothetical protein
MKIINRYALLVAFFSSVVDVLVIKQTRNPDNEIASAITGALFFYVPLLLANMIVTKIHGDPLERKKQ